MDPVVRDVDQDIEMEPLWVTAFTLQMKLTHIISVMQEWCASDAEEAQRKLKRQNGEDPALPPFCPLFASLVNILQCDVLLGMLGAVLQWAMELSGGHWSESMLQRMVVSIKTMRECTAAAAPCEGTGHCHKETVWDKDKAERKRKAELCWKKTMAQTLESQSHFINKYIDLLKQDSEDLDASASTSAEHSPSSCDGALVCVGPRRWRARGGERRQMEMCILCHEAQEILPDGTAMVLAAFVQRSTVMSKNRKRPPHNPESYDPLFMHPDLSFGTHTGSCGHIMHSHCWQRSVGVVRGVTLWSVSAGRSGSFVSGGVVERCVCVGGIAPLPTKGVFVNEFVFWWGEIRLKRNNVFNVGMCLCSCVALFRLCKHIVRKA
ncbi:E3 ubiquitin-protein ligase UBR2-like isoform X2 [Ictalurus furcatus]|nr:E3 ubiquitin-protein ligase UBR2-like isoform X2 [Ictalurus furcatus]